MPINVFMDFYKVPPRFFNKNKAFIGKIENKQTTIDTIYCLRQDQTYRIHVSHEIVNKTVWKCQKLCLYFL